MSIKKRLGKAVYASYLWMNAGKFRERYASHLPVLLAMAIAVQPKRLLELGSGLFSTPALLDRNMFPTLESITSIEDDAGWLQRVRAEVPADARHHLIATASVPDWCLAADLSGFDVIFIDDSTTVENRAMTIRAVLERASAEVVIVIHDFQFDAYRKAVAEPWMCHVFEAFYPSTGVVYQNTALQGRLRALDQCIRDNRTVAPASDHAAWAAILQRQAGSA
jgi:hypothetical protein